MKSLFITLLVFVGIGAVSSSDVELNHHDESHDHLHELMSPMQTDTVPTFPYQKTEAEWKEFLTPTQYRILRKKGTEIPYINEYFDLKDDGIYVCAGCSTPVFESQYRCCLWAN